MKEENKYSGYEIEDSIKETPRLREASRKNVEKKPELTVEIDKK